MIRLVALLSLALLAACGGEPVTVGSKDTPENRVLARMIALLLEDRGVAVERRIPVGDTVRTFAALRRGAIDVYPEYAGTALSQLGRAPIADPEAALSAAREGFAAYGLDWLAPLGFEANYVVATTARVAARHGLRSFDDLGPAAPDLRLGVTEAFSRRTGDGLRPWLERYGLAFGAVEVTPGADRGRLYDQLAAGGLDVIVGVSTDPDMESLALTALADPDGFFPAYPAAPLARRAAIERAPALTEVAQALSGRLDADMMRELTAAVVQEGLTPREAAEGALARLGLLDRAEPPATPPLLLAVTEADRGGAAANRAIRALRAAVRGRRVAIMPVTQPLDAMRAGDARLALSPAIAHFEIVDGRARLASDVETAAVVGTMQVHTLVAADGPARLADARRIGTGPVGSSSHMLATALAAHLAAQPEIVPLPGGSSDDAGAALSADRIDAALILAEAGRADLVAALGEGGLTLADSASWWRGSARLDLPFLREARPPSSAYGPALREIPTLAMQLTLAGPASAIGDPLGRSGPSVVAAGPEPLTRPVARRLDAALGGQEAVSPHLRAATVLVPEAPRARSDVGFAPDRGLLFVGIAAFVGWACWLAIRPRARGRARDRESG